MMDPVHPTVAMTVCPKCGQRLWRKVNETLLWDGVTRLQTYVCDNALCPGRRKTERGFEGWPLSWAYRE